MLATGPLNGMPATSTSYGNDLLKLINNAPLKSNKKMKAVEQGIKTGARDLFPSFIRSEKYLIEGKQLEMGYFWIFSHST